MNKGDEFVKLWKENKNSLFTTSLSLEKNNKDNAEDLMQDTLLKAYKSFGKYSPEFKFTTWVRVIMKNTYIDKYRKVKDYYFNSLDTDEELSVSNKMTDNGYSKILYSMDYDDVIKFVDNEIPYRIQKSFKMWLENYSYKEISDEIDLPVGTVKSHVHMARTKIIKNFPK